MSEHGRVILSRMVELIGEYEAGRVQLRRLVDELQSMSESLDPAEQPPEREWQDVIIPLDRAGGGSGRDQVEVRRQIEERMSRLKALLGRCRTAA